MNRRKLTRFAIVLGIPTLYAIILRLMFGSWADTLAIMSCSFLLCLPIIVGALTIYFSSIKYVEKRWYCFFVPWVPIFLFFIVTVLLSLEGWACWLMILPIFLLLSSVGGLIAGYFILRKKDRRVYVSLLPLLPFLIMPIENFIGPTQSIYQAYNYIDINASAERIWDNVTRVRKIDELQDKGYLTKLLGFPRPVEAELNYLGVGAKREARFTKELVFHETVLEYKDKEKMVFQIKAYPYEIPSTTMDEHVVIGGRYFDVLTGTYQLEKLDDNKYRLHLYSSFKLNTTFNFYANWWARWIMQDIQQNILQIEKIRAEEH